MTGITSVRETTKPAFQAGKVILMTGRQAYEADVAIQPTYEDGTPRKAWGDLPGYAKDSWERNPTIRARKQDTESSC